MLTNFATIRKAVKKMTEIDKMTADGTFDNLSKREKLQISRQRAKLELTLGSIADMNKLPNALFVVDVMKEHIAVAEAKRLGIPVFAIVDTNSDPSNVDYVIPANDDSTAAVEVIVSAICGAISEVCRNARPKVRARKRAKAKVALSSFRRVAVPAARLRLPPKKLKLSI